MKRVFHFILTALHSKWIPEQLIRAVIIGDHELVNDIHRLQYFEVFLHVEPLDSRLKLTQYSFYFPVQVECGCKVFPR